MIAARIYSQEHEIAARLVPFGVTRAELLQVALAVAGARADAVENDPLTAEGQFAYIFGTRNVRVLFRSKGWQLYRHENIESVRHPDNELKVIYQSVDEAASTFHDPRAVSAKGSGSDRIIVAGQGELLTREALEITMHPRFAKPDSGAWYFCVSVNGDDIRAELSLPASIDSGNFHGFIERIFVSHGGDGGEPTAKVNRDGLAGEAAEFEPHVTRK